MHGPNEKCDILLMIHVKFHFVNAVNEPFGTFLTCEQLRLRLSAYRPSGVKNSYL